MSEPMGSAFGVGATQDPRQMMIAQALMQQRQPESNPLAAPSSGPYTIEDGPEYNKWIDVLAERGTIRLPKERDDPQQWLSRPDMLDMLERGKIDRRDLPDGSVVLSRKAYTS